MSWFWPFRKHLNTPNHHSFDNFTLIEGISDDTILLCLFTFSLAGLFFYYSRLERRTTIHPDNQQDVNVLREQAQRNENNNDNREDQRFVGRPRQDTCPICLTDSSIFSVETNCGHLFCGQCIITFWKFQTNWLTGMNCPVCRRQVTALLRCFTADEDAAIDNPMRQSVINDITDFNHRFSGAPRSFMENVRDIPVLIPHILRQIFSINTFNWTYRIRIYIIIFFVIAYVLSPLDILPESVVGILGLLDDLIFLVLGALYLIILFRQFISQN